MEQQAREQTFISALTTEQFVLQAARSANVGEMTGRGTIYMGAVSSSLIALGFLAQVVSRLEPFVAAVLPAVFLLGEFTFAALLRNTLENLVLLGQMQRIRGYYRSLVPEAEEFFGQAAEAERVSAAMATVGLRARPVGMLFTGASVVAAINSVVGGVGLALLPRRSRAWPPAPHWRSAALPRWSCSGCTCSISSSEPRPWFCGHRPRQHRPSGSRPRRRAAPPGWRRRQSR
jgi:hypothetical protein